MAAAYGMAWRQWRRAYEIAGESVRGKAQRNGSVAAAKIVMKYHKQRVKMTYHAAAYHNKRMAYMALARVSQRIGIGISSKRRARRLSKQYQHGRIEKMAYHISVACSAPDDVAAASCGWRRRSGGQRNVCSSVASSKQIIIA